MAQPAYRYDSAKKEQVRRNTKPKAELRSVKGGKSRPVLLRAALNNAVQILALAVLVAFAVALLQSNATSNELTAEIQESREKLQFLQNEYGYYSDRLSEETGIQNIEKAAERLGLMKIDPSQITYIRLREESVLTRH